MAVRQESTLGIDDFETVCRVVRRVCGIELDTSKHELVQARLAKRLRALHLESYAEYVDLLRVGPDLEELSELIDAISTNVTSFFREAHHFEHLGRMAAAHNESRRDGFRAWSAGCSSGEEPYAMAMTVLDSAPRISFEVLATDISRAALSRARSGVYGGDRVAGIPQALRSRFLECVGDNAWSVAPRVRDRVHFARLNLMADWPMTGPFDAIFCRNTMIYFEVERQRDLVDRFGRLLRGGGCLYLGHSESLPNSADRFEYEEPTIYRRRQG